MPLLHDEGIRPTSRFGDGQPAHEPSWATRGFQGLAHQECIRRMIKALPHIFTFTIVQHQVAIW